MRVKAQWTTGVPQTTAASLGIVPRVTPAGQAAVASDAVPMLVMSVASLAGLVLGAMGGYRFVRKTWGGA